MTIPYQLCIALTVLEYSVFVPIYLYSPFNPLRNKKLHKITNPQIFIMSIPHFHPKNHAVLKQKRIEINHALSYLSI
jgi:hypothetical protein